RRCRPCRTGLRPRGRCRGPGPGLGRPGLGRGGTWVGTGPGARLACRAAGLGRRAATGLGRGRGGVLTAGRRECLTETPDDRRLECRRRRLDELSLIAELRQKFFTGDTELFCQFVYPGLACHCSPHCEVFTAGLAARPRSTFDGRSSLELHGVLIVSGPFLFLCSPYRFIRPAG